MELLPKRSCSLLFFFGDLYLPHIAPCRTLRLLSRVVFRVFAANLFRSSLPIGHPGGRASRHRNRLPFADTSFPEIGRLLPTALVEGISFVFLSLFLSDFDSAGDGIQSGENPGRACMADHQSPRAEAALEARTRLSEAFFDELVT